MRASDVAARAGSAGVSGVSGVSGVPGVSGSILERNLAALSPRNAALVARIRGVSARVDAVFIATDDGVPGLLVHESPARGPAANGPTVDDPLGLGGAFLDAALPGAEAAGVTPAPPGVPAALTSRRRPLAEAERLADEVDLTAHGAVCVLGFAAGYHAQALARRGGRGTAVFVYEPDLPLLRAVLERVDHAAWLAESGAVILTDPDDAPAMSAAASGVEGLMALGVKMLAHPPSVKRLGEGATRFVRTFTTVLKAVRTTVLTTLVQTEPTLRNMAMNADYYAGCPGILDLSGAASGHPAVVVSAGPSLERNIDLLTAPGVRDRVVIIATQTTLKPLLRRGIRPHYVCALDHHEISRRFYEGLSADDLAGVTLVVEPKANPAIPDAFAGRVRITGDERLEALLGPALASPKGTLKAGATVAHLCGYLARHLGCDPVVLIGQDLGFTDGHYYAAGAAIHDVWGPELGEFRTLEMFEWERIAREKSLLRRTVDVFGRPIYTDEQMSTYLAQFEVDFAADAALGRRVWDATEGGVAKRGTTPMPLSEALACFASLPGHALPATPERDGSPERRGATAARVGFVAGQAREVAALSREAGGVMREMRDRHGDAAAVNRLIERVYALRDEVRTLEPAYGLTLFLNQAGTLKRFRADRLIDLARDTDEMARQRKQIERDITNLEWLADAADSLAKTLDAAQAALEGRAAKITRDVPPPAAAERTDTDLVAATSGGPVGGIGGDASTGDERAAMAAANSGGPGRRRVAAVLCVDEALSGLGTPRDVRRELVPGQTALSLAVERLLRAEGLCGVVVLSGQPASARAALGAVAGDPRVRVEGVGAAEWEAWRARTRTIGAARRFSPAAWRGGLAGLSQADEGCSPSLLAGAMSRHALDAAVLVSPDAALVDPGLIDAQVARYEEQPSVHKIVLTQAAVGLGGLLVDAATAATMGRAEAEAGVFGTLGALMAYVPFAPQADPIAKTLCVRVSPAVRDAGVRLIADTAEGMSALRGLARSLGRRFASADSEDVAAALAGGGSGSVVDWAGVGPAHVTLELCTGRLSCGEWTRRVTAAWGGHETPPMAAATARRVIDQLAAWRPDATLTLGGQGDPLLHPDALELAAHAAGRGLAVHVRTEALHDRVAPADLVRSGAAVVSVDVLSVSAEAYRALSGLACSDRVREGVEAMLAMRRDSAGAAGLGLPWVSPRLTRADEVAAEIEVFYDGWLRAGASPVIDAALPAEAPVRLRPLPRPAGAMTRLERTSLTIRADGRVLGAAEAVGSGVLADPVGSVVHESLETVWRRALRARRRDELWVQAPGEGAMGAEAGEAGGVAAGLAELKPSADATPAGEGAAA